MIECIMNSNLKSTQKIHTSLRARWQIVVKNFVTELTIEADIDYEEYLSHGPRSFRIAASHTQADRHAYTLYKTTNYEYLYNFVSFVLMLA